MKIIKKILSVAIAVIMVLGCAACDIYTADYTAKHLKVEEKKNIKVWYTESAYTEYLIYVARSFNAANSLISIEPVLVEAADYLEQIYKESIYNDNVADVYIMPSGMLEEAGDMGLVLENTTYSKYYTEKKYSRAAIEAAKLGDRLYGYPLSYNIPFMVYNKKAADEITTAAQLEEFCQNYQVNEDNQSIKRLAAWDISDSLVNYGFASDAIDMQLSHSGIYNISVDKKKLTDIMTRMYELKYTMGFERTEMTLDLATEEFVQGNLAYTIIDAEHIKELVTSDIEYGVCAVMSLSENMPTAKVSETDLVVVNPYATDQEVAKAVAHAISYDYSGALFSYSYMLSAKNVSYDKAYKKTLGKVAELYKQSDTMTQYLGSENIYAQYEILLGKIWDGQNIEESIDSFIKSIEAEDSSAKAPETETPSAEAGSTTDDATSEKQDGIQQTTDASENEDVSDSGDADVSEDEDISDSGDADVSEDVSDSGDADISEEDVFDSGDADISEEDMSDGEEAGEDTE